MRKLVTAALLMTLLTFVAGEAFGQCQLAPPVLHDPPDNSVVGFGTLTLRWDEVANATTYEPFLSLDAKPFESLGSGFLNRHTLVVGPGHTAQWFVKANGPSCVGSSSQTFSFTTDCPQDVPSISSPARGARFGVTDTITFSWSDVAGASSYDIFVTADGGQTFAPLEENILGRSFTSTMPEGDWGWYVRANFEGTCTPAVSQPSQFFVGAQCTNAAPKLRSPGNGDKVTLPVTFEWEAAPGATGYAVLLVVGTELRLVGKTAGTSLVLDHGVQGTVAWFVQAEFPDDCPAVESERRTLTIETSSGCPTGTAVPQSPPTGATNLASPVTFSWQGVPGATGYRVLASIGGSDPVSLGTTTSTSLTADVPAGSGYWLVQTFFGDNCPGTLSARSTLTVSAGATCPTTVPKTVSPATGAVNVVSPVTFSWTAVEKASKYLVFVSADDGDAEADFDFYGASETTTLTAFVPDGTVRWFVVAVIPGCPDARSTIASFTAGTPDTCPNGTITLRAPAQDASVSAPVTLAWSAAPGVQAYRVTISDGESFLTRRTTNTEESFDLPAGTMTWYVEGLREDCPAIVSAKGRFTVQRAATCAGNQAPALFAPVGTEANPAVVTTPVSFNWNPSANAIGYRLWISRNGNAFEDVGVTIGTQAVVPLSAGRYAWYLEALFRNCDGVASQKAYFVIRETAARCPGVAPTPIAPAPGSTVAAPVEFKWTAVSGALKYRVFITTAGAEEKLAGATEETELTRALPPGPISWRVEAVFEDCPSASSARLTFTIPQASECPPDDPVLLSPANGATLTDNEVTFAWAPVSGAVRYVVVAETRDGSKIPLGETTETTLTRKLPYGAIEWEVYVFFAGCPPRESADFRFTITPDQNCINRAPVLLVPADRARLVFSPVVFAWTRVANATGYQVWIAQGEGKASIIATTTDTTASADLPAGRYEWFVEARFAGCPSTESATGEITVASPPACGTPDQPKAHVVGQALSGTPYRVRWTALPNISVYEVQESTSASFDGAQTFVTSETSMRFVHEVSGNPVQYFYRVRGVSRCNESRGTYSDPVSVFVVAQRTNSSSAELGLEGTIVQKVVLPGSPAPVRFTATVDKPWLTVTPSTGTLGTEPVTLTVTSDPAALFLGTNTGTVRVAYSALSGGTVKSEATPTTTTVPISVSLVTPVTPGGKGTPPPESLVFPVVGHAAGVNDSLFESDIRVANLTPQTMKYQVTFTPSGSDGTQTGSSTTIEIPPNTTTALDDIVSSLFGTGTTTSALGMLEVRPLTTSSATTSLFSTVATAFPALPTAASSRTYNFTPSGTFGQFIPAIPFAKFAGKGSVLSLLQVSQSAAYRANFGFAEAAGSPVDLMVRVYDTRSNLLATIPVSLGASQHTQINGMLASNGITDLPDGRVEVEVVNGSGKVTAYVSEIDNKTSDPLLVSAVAKGGSSANRYVVPGMAYISSSFAFWVSDLRIFNAGPSTTATLTFYPQGGGAPAAKQVTIDAGEIEVLDNVVGSFFAQPNGAGGAIAITTPAASQLSATARTYNQTSNGTYGQFIPAVTVAESVGSLDRALQILQLETSSRIRTNVGVTETTGNGATVEITAIQPDSIVTPVVTFDLAPNEFRQLPLAGFFAEGAAVYNARVSVKVIGGSGRVTAYGSAIDTITQDPTYVPAQ